MLKSTNNTNEYINININNGIGNKMSNNYQYQSSNNINMEILKRDK